MEAAVVILAVLGALAAGGLGAKWMTDFFAALAGGFLSLKEKFALAGGRRMSALMAVTSLALGACGAKDSDEAALIAACMNEGDTETFCTCQGETLRAELDQETFAALADFAEAMAGAVNEDTQGMIAMGALTNPKLVAALDKREAATRTCREAAALEQTRAEVMAAEAARAERALRAASRKCPHKPAMAPRLPGAPVDDVADLRPGMSFDDVEAMLECRGDVANLDTAQEWARKSHGIETRQLLRAADGDICPAEARIAGAKACTDGGWGFEPLEHVTQEFIVAFTGMPGAERAGVIWRRTVFPEGERPTVSSLVEALTEKYGRPHVRATEENYYSLGHRRGTIVQSWTYASGGSPIPSGDSSLKSRCVNGPRPTFQRQMSWNGTCGLTIRAEIMRADGNDVLARELNVVVMDQQPFDNAVKQFGTNLEDAAEAQHRDQGTAPDL